nr:hypothetical protein [Subtercola lobariae]
MGDVSATDDVPRQTAKSSMIGKLSLRHLAGTQHDGVSCYDRLSPEVFNVHARVIDAEILHPRQKLHEDVAALSMHSLDDLRVVVDIVSSDHRGPSGPRSPRFIWGDFSRNDEVDTSSNALRIESGHAFESVLGIFQTDMHRTHHHSIPQAHSSHDDRGEKVIVGGHFGTHPSSRHE